MFVLLSAVVVTVAILVVVILLLLVNTAVQVQVQYSVLPCCVQQEAAQTRTDRTSVTTEKICDDVITGGLTCIYSIYSNITVKTFNPL